MDKKFGFSIQKKAPKEVNVFKVRKSKRNVDVIPGKLIEFMQVRVEDGTIYPVARDSQSIIGLKKYFREAWGRFIVEKTTESAKCDIKTCHKYRKGAMVKGYIIQAVDISGDVDKFFIKDYLEITK